MHGSARTSAFILFLFIRGILFAQGLAAYALGSSIVDSNASMERYWTVICLFASATPAGIFAGYLLANASQTDGAAAISSLASGHCLTLSHPWPFLLSRTPSLRHSWLLFVEDLPYCSTLRIHHQQCGFTTSVLRNEHCHSFRKLESTSQHEHCWPYHFIHTLIVSCKFLWGDWETHWVWQHNDV